MRFAQIALVAACGGDGSKSIDAPSAVDAANDSGTCSPFVMYLNRKGETYNPGPDDSTINRSSMFQTTRTVPMPVVDNADWATVLACVQEKFSLYNATVVDVDPTPMPHIEVVIINNGTQVGFPGLSNGVPATPCVGGFPTAVRNTIALASWEGNNPNRCWTIAQALGYTAGLDNVLPCEDLMSVAPTPCSILGKQFIDQAAQCGQGTAEPCRCGGQMQNTKQRVLANIGPKCN